MTAAAATAPTESPATSGATPPEGWDKLRADGDLQFAPVTLPEIPPREPGWLARLFAEVFEFLANLFAPLGRMLGGSWWWLQWVLVALVALFALYLIARLIGPELLANRRPRPDPAAQDEWRPDRAASLALLEDADRLAAEGRFDEATRLLLQRSVSHIAAARPDWVEPSSTARELAALPALPGPARAAFAVIAGRVEASLFALRALDRPDWEAARAAYAEFALARLDPRTVAA